MVELLIGKKGTGKTKVLIDGVNEAAAVAAGVLGLYRFNH